jgi:hypothetical protein
MARRLSVEDRAQLERRREQLALELKLITAELRSDEVLRLQDGERERERERAEQRPRLEARWRDWVR